MYIDLNMVRAGVVEHPSEWDYCGYKEIQSPPKRYSIIDRPRLMELAGIDDSEELSRTHKRWVEEILGTGETSRQVKWTESVAVGSKHFIDTVRDKLGIRVAGRDIIMSGVSHELREPGVSYSCDFGAKNGILNPKNTYFWDFDS
jgi:hypothetical protein